MADPDSNLLKEQVRQANDIVEVIGAYVPLKQAGAKFRGLSPFNREKTPSFYVDPGKQMFYCFSSHQGGDVFNFVMLYENLDFPGALRRLAERVGIEIPERTRFNGGGSDRGLRDNLFHLHDAVTLWWAEQLHREPAAEVARQYLKGRAFGSALAREFAVGYAPEGWDTTLNWATKKGFSREVIDQSGLVSIDEDKGTRYDRFRGRLMFPIRNEVGKVVAFSGRLLDTEAKAAKYVNSPETAIFVKSKTLFGLDKAKQAIRDEGFVLLCEGQIDMIRCYEKGFRNTVASQGTAFNESHARLLQRFAQKAVICFDADRAGLKAAFGTAEKLLESGVEVRVATMPAGDDPDTLLRREGGAEVLRGIVSGAPDYTRHTLDAACREHDVSSPRGRGLVAERMALVVARIPNVIQRERVALEVASRLEVPLPVFRQELDKAAVKLKTPAASFEPDAIVSEVELPFTAHAKVRAILSLCLHHPMLVAHVQRGLHSDCIASFEGGALLNRFLVLHGDGAWVDENDFIDQLPPAERNFVAQLLVEDAPEKPAEAGGAADMTKRAFLLQVSRQVEPPNREKFLLDIVGDLQAEWHHRRIKELEQQVKSGLLSPDKLMEKTKELLELRRKLTAERPLT